MASEIKEIVTDGSFTRRVERAAGDTDDRSNKVDGLALAGAQIKLKAQTNRRHFIGQREAALHHHGSGFLRAESQRLAR